MIIGYANDGQVIDREKLVLDGFIINDKRDFLKKNVTEDNIEETEEYDSVLNFVGFLVNDNNDLFSVFPKNYKVKELDKDSAQLFSVISKHMQRRPDTYLGNEYGRKLKTNYPFAAFFGIYEYYAKYGLYFDDNIYIKPNIGGEVNWKDTIRLSNKYITNGKLSFHPLYYNKKYYYSALLTECMIFTIDYTLEKFGVFIDLKKTGRPLLEYDMLHEKETIIDYLFNLRQQTFKDSIIELIDNLILFFTELNEGGSYYFKHYIFSSVWEHMVMEYLRETYKEVKDNMIVFDEARSKPIPFTKPLFHPNLANNEQYFSPDYYYCDGDTQLIFDAKYYTKIQGMNYKQIAYYLFLSEQREKIEEDPKYTNTYSALILPAEQRSSKIHFKMNPLFNKLNAKLVISEEYLDIRRIIEFYLEI